MPALMPLSQSLSLAHSLLLAHSLRVKLSTLPDTRVRRRKNGTCRHMARGGFPRFADGLVTPHAAAVAASAPMDRD